MTTAPRYFFVHMQRTGGITLRHRLIHHFGETAVYPSSSDDGQVLFHYLIPEYLLERLKARGDEIQVVTGHFPLCTVELLGGGPWTTFTMLRRPVDRIVSFLRNRRAKYPPDAGKTLEEVYGDPRRLHRHARNHMTKMLSLTAEEMTAGMLTRLECTPAHLERAKEALAGIDAVGVHERFEDFCDLLSARFGWDLGPRAALNAAPPADVDERLRSRILEDNAYDIELYEFAVDLIARRAPPAPTAR